MTLEGSRVYVAGSRGLVGSAITRVLGRMDGVTLLDRSRQELDLTDATATARFFESERPDFVFLAAARVGGIAANSAHPWEFLYDNLRIQNSVLGAALSCRTPRVVFLGSSCIYPKLAPQPITEDALLSGPLEPTNEAYAIAKIAGAKLVQAATTEYGMQWVTLMPTNLYGPGDNFDPETSHVLPAMIRKFEDARQARLAGDGGARVVLWGTGRVRRELLHVDDLAAAAVHIAASTVTGLLNVGSGSDVTIRELADFVARATTYDGPVDWDTSRPDGTPQKLLDSSKLLATGWSPRITLQQGIADTVAWYRAHVEEHSYSVAS